MLVHKHTKAKGCLLPHKLFDKLAVCHFDYLIPLLRAIKHENYRGMAAAGDLTVVLFLMICLVRVNTSLSSFLLLKCLSRWARVSRHSIVPVRWLFFFDGRRVFWPLAGLFNGVQTISKRMIWTKLNLEHIGQKWSLSLDYDCAAVTSRFILVVDIDSPASLAAVQFALSLCNLPRAVVLKFIRYCICHTGAACCGLRRANLRISTTCIKDDVWYFPLKFQTEST